MMHLMSLSHDGPTNNSLNPFKVPTEPDFVRILQNPTTSDWKTAKARARVAARNKKPESIR